MVPPPEAAVDPTIAGGGRFLKADLPGNQLPGYKAASPPPSPAGTSRDSEAIPFSRGIPFPGGSGLVSPGLLDY